VQKMPENKWYESWFDTGYYHLLYEERDEEEANNFIRQLIKRLSPPEDGFICDLACGNGRHSRVIAAAGYDVVGLDLSQNSISLARQAKHDAKIEAESNQDSAANSRLKRGDMEFYVHDMRKPFRVRYFDWVFNLFTSFGYFETDKEHITVLKNISRAIKPNGGLILDFLNAPKTIENLQPQSSYEKEGIQFEIEREFKDGFIQKHIHISEKDRSIRFTEKVRAYTLLDFRNMLDEVGMRIIDTYGSYDLGAYEPEVSDRLILQASLK